MVNADKVQYQQTLSVTAMSLMKAVLFKNLKFWLSIKRRPNTLLYI